MTRLIFVPQYPTTLRYQEWWWSEFPTQLSKHFQVRVLGESFVRATATRKLEREELFSPVELSVELEVYQIREYMELGLNDSDILLLNDISFPGLFANVLLHKRPKKCFTICHASSKNRFDYFSKVRKIKYPIEKALSKLFDKVIVGSEYHKDKLKWDNIQVLYLPNPPMPKPTPPIDKNGIVIVSRKGVQKRTSRLERLVTKTFGRINRIDSQNWGGYYFKLAGYQAMLITSKEETFGYQIVDAVNCGVVPVAPNKMSYPELLPREYLYDTKEEMIEILRKAIKGELEPPKQLKTTEESNMFFETLASLMK